MQEIALERFKCLRFIKSTRSNDRMLKRMVLAQVFLVDPKIFLSYSAHNWSDSGASLSKMIERTDFWLEFICVRILESIHMHPS